MLYYLAKYVLLGPFIWLFLRPRILGKENLRFKGPAIVVCNHSALSDPVILAATVPETIHFMAKKELFGNPLARFFFEKLLFAFPVNRGKSDIASIRHAIEVLKEGKVFGLFPEGTRCVTGEMDILEKGASFFALKTGAKIIPMYLRPGTLRRFRIHMSVGEAIDPEIASKLHPGRPVDVLTQVIADRMQQLRIMTEDDWI